MQLLLLSNSTNHAADFLAHARKEIAALAAGRPICFIPFALDDWDGYTERVREALRGDVIVGAHEQGTPAEAVLAAEVVFAGGGNTFRLLSALERLNLVEELGERVRSGQCAYIGSSAGTNVACPTMRTTNDMPIVSVESFDSLHLVPFQVNPHFTDSQPLGLMTETRRERIAQFLERSATPVLGLREGSWLRVEGATRTIGGSRGAVVFTREGVCELASGDSVDNWWNPPVFDDEVPMLLATATTLDS